MNGYASSNSELAGIITGIAFSGHLSLHLAGMLPLPALLVIAVVHVVIWRWFFVSQAFPRTPFVGRSVEWRRDAGGLATEWLSAEWWSAEWLFAVVSLGIVAVEVLRMIFGGREMVLPALRDLIVALALVRFVLPKRPREMYQIMGIAIAQCVLATVFTISPLFLVALLLLMALIPPALHALDALSFGNPGRAHTGGHWAAVWVGVVVWSAALFYVLPRPASTLLDFGFAERQAVTGFSEDVSLEQRTRVVETRSVALRVVWLEGVRPERFYLAGARLEKATPEGFVRTAEGGAVGERPKVYSDRLQVYPTGLTVRNVFFPFALVKVSPGPIREEGGTWYWGEEMPPVYEVWVRRGPVKGTPGNLDVPPELAQVAALGRRLGGAGPTADRVERLISWLGTSCSYSLDRLSVPAGVAPLEWFVFDGRRGSCEHYAAALAVMLRGCGIPARVVTGFYVNEFNPNGEYFIVRARGAHAWVEYWDRGAWLTVDATPRTITPVRHRAQWLDAARFRWIRWVIEYSLEDQLNLAGYVAFRMPGELREQSGRLARTGGALLGMAAGVGVLVVLIRRRRQGPYRRVLRAFARRGMVLSEHDHHERHLMIVRRTWPAMAPPFKRYLGFYLAWRFGSRPADIRPHTTELLEKIKELPRKRP